MKGSITTSAIVHVTVLAMALVSIGSPEPLDFTDTEALPVELVPIEEISQIQQGDKSAPLAEKSAPKPTTKPQTVPEAQNLGDNNVDLKSPPTPSTRPSNNETAAAPPKQETPQPVVDDKSNDVKEIVKEETSAPKEVAALPQQKPEITPPKPPEPKPEPVKQTPPEPKPAEAAPPEEAPAEAALPDAVPLPNMRPKPPEKPAEAKPAETKPAEKPAEKKVEHTNSTEKPSDRKPGEKNRETAKSASSKESDFNADEVAALLNKNQSSGGGAKRSTDQAALGGRQTTGGSKLSQTEMDALRGIIQKNWQIIPGMVDAGQVRIKVTMKLDRNGEIIGQPKVEATGGTEGVQRALAGGALRAVKRSAPFTSLPPDKYDAWSEVIVNFDPSELL